MSESDPPARRVDAPVLPTDTVSTSEASASPHEADHRRRRRLNRELDFSSPGPAFQLLSPPPLPPANEAGSSRRSSRHSQRTPKPSKAALESGMLSTWKPEPLPSAADVLVRCQALYEQLAHADVDALRAKHDALVRELFHLTQVITKSQYDPDVAHLDTSDVFAHFQTQYHLALNMSPDSSRHARRTSARRPMPSSPPNKRIRLSDKRRAASPPSPPPNVALVPLSSGTSLDPQHPPSLTYTSPWQRPLPPNTPGGSLASFLQSFAYWDDDIVKPEVRAQRVARMKAVSLRLDQLQREGKSLSDTHTTALAKLKPHEAPRGKAHWDYVLEGICAQAQHTRQGHRHRMQLAKKVSRMVSAHWERTLHSDEREQKLEWRRQRALAKWTMREVQRQWRLAVTVIRSRKQAVERAEREKLGKMQLQAILEQSTQMLETQHADLSSLQEDPTMENASEEMVSQDEEAGTTEHSATEDEDSASDSADDERLEREMWQEDEADEEEDNDLQADADLPLEDLLKKYGYPPAEPPIKSEAGAEASPESDASESEEGPSISLKDLLGEEKEAAGTLVKVHKPFLFRGSLRPYQQVGMEWLISLYNNQVNGILADEMGLGKTIQTIALLAHLACDRGNWGPHLIVAPTSVMLNWEMEFKKFLPGFKILSYYGSQKQRKAKRVGWNTPNSFHVCITSYQLVLADQHIFRRKPWVYLVLDEAHHIKNFRSQRWQTLLGFNSERRLLLTGTPLQNNLMDLWSLMYFLMPQGIAQVAAASGAFSNMKDFQDWFSNPLGKAVESSQALDDETRATVAKLHTVLRPFVLRRLKSDVEQEMPKKYEHIMPCRLSKRQRFLYNDFMSRAKTRESLASGNYMSIINCLMQLRKVCNHPDLFEPRPIVTPFVTRAVACDYEIKDLLVRRRLLRRDPWRECDLNFLRMSFVQDEPHLTPLVTHRYRDLDASAQVAQAVAPPKGDASWQTTKLEAFQRALSHCRARSAYEHAQHMAYVNRMRTCAEPVYGRHLLASTGSASPPNILPMDVGASRDLCMTQCDALRSAVLSRSERSEGMHDVVSRFAFVTPPAMATDVPRLLLGHATNTSNLAALPDPLHNSAVALNVAFPDASLLQYDCGKLQQLDALMRQLVDGGHRALIFTQMTKVLDILEKFFNYHGYRYLRLDGATKVEQRQALTERFNRDARISAFILSTRSGGLGINLVGADTVIFYDLDWNAAIEAQCMDRAHRIGQTRDVHIYRFVSEHTIEENMLRKANQKRRLDQMVIQQGQFTTEHLAKNDWRDMLDGGTSLGGVHVGEESVTDAKDVEQAFRAAEDAEDAAAVHVANEEHQMDHADFEGDIPESRPKPPSRSSPTSYQTPLPPTSDDSDAYEEEEPMGSIDDYMLRYVGLKSVCNTNMAAWLRQTGPILVLSTVPCARSVHHIDTIHDTCLFQ